MALPAQVCLIGNSQPYLDIRAAVLQHFWTVRTIALDHGETPQFTGELVVICASVPASEQQTLVDRARHDTPQMLIVRVDGFDPRPLAGADAIVEDDHGPGALVSTIYELLTERGFESREWLPIPDGGWVQ